MSASLASLAASRSLHLGLPTTTPRVVVERLRPFFLADPDFAATLRVQLDAARAEIFAQPSSPSASRPTPR